MILVKVWRDKWRRVTRFEVSGHGGDGPDDAEGTSVCNAVSTLMVTLWHATGMHGLWNEGDVGPEANGDHTGYILVRVPFQAGAWVDFVEHGLRLIRDNYPGRIEFEELRSSEEDVVWSQATLLTD